MSFTQTEATIIQMLTSLEERICGLTEAVEQLDERVSALGTTKDWYSTTELAQALGLSRYTVTERLCNQGRIACEKDPVTGKWRIPGHEYERLQRGGQPNGI